MDSKIWGSYAWYFIHLLTYCMPTNTDEFNKYKQHYIDFFNSLAVLLPCSKCRAHYKAYISKNTIAEYCVNKNKAVQWMIDLHNDVSRRLTNYGIKRNIYSRPDVDNIYLDKSGNIKINHQKLAVFPNIILNTTVNIPQSKVFLVSLKHIHPCKLCANIIKEELDIFKVDKLTAKNNFIDLSNKLIPRLRIEHTEGTLIPTFKLFNRQFVLNKDNKNNNTWKCIVFDPNIEFYKITQRNNRWELCISYKNKTDKAIFTNKAKTINPPLHEVLWTRE